MASVHSSSALFLAAWCRDRKSFMCLERASRILHPFPRDQGVVPWTLLTFLEDRSDICSLPVLRNCPNCLNFPEVMEWSCVDVGQVPQHSRMHPIKSQASSTWYSQLISYSSTGWALPRSDEIHRAAARKAPIDVGWQSSALFEHSKTFFKVLKLEVTILSPLFVYECRP